MRIARWDKEIFANGRAKDVILITEREDHWFEYRTVRQSLKKLSFDFSKLTERTDV